MSKYAPAIAYLKQHSPKRKAGEDMGLVPDGEIVRRWNGVPPDLIGGLTAYLFNFTDIENGEKPSKSVNGLVMQGETMPGLWRCTGITPLRDEENHQNYVVEQRFRRGYLTTADWTEARIEAVRFSNSNDGEVPGVADTTSDNPSIGYVIKFPNVAPQYVDDIKTALQTENVEDPYVQDKLGRRVKLAGTYNVISVANRLEDDFSHSVLLDIQISKFTVAAFVNWGTSRQQLEWKVWSVAAPEVDAIIAAFKVAYPTRSSVSVDRLENNVCNLTLRFRSDNPANFSDMGTSVSCRFLESTSYHFGVIDPEDAAFNLPTDPTLTPGITYEKRVSDNGDGTYDVVIVARERQRQQKSYRSADDAAKRTETDIDLGAPSTITSIVASQGEIIRRRVELLEDCLVNVETDTTEVKNQTAAGADESRFEQTTRATETENTAQETIPATIPDRVRYSVNNAPTDAGNWRTEVAIEEAQQVDDARQSALVDAESKKEEVLDRNVLDSATPSLPSTYTVGNAIVRVEIERTPHKNTSNVITTTETPTKFVGGWIEHDDINGTVYRRSFVNVAEADFGSASADDPLVGVDNSTNNSLQASRNKFGLYDGVVIRSPDTGGGLTNAVYDNVGEFLVGEMKSQDQTRTLAAVIYYTRSKTDCQKYIRGLATGATTLYDTNAKLATALGWTTALTVTHAGAWSTGPQRDKGTGRYRAVRCVLKTA